MSNRTDPFDSDATLEDLFGSESETSSSKSKSSSKPANKKKVPEVGMEELNSLADLFETETSDEWEQTWQEEILNSSESEQDLNDDDWLNLDDEAELDDLLEETPDGQGNKNQANGASSNRPSSASSLDIEDEFADLLMDESSSSESNEDVSDDLSSLFGEDFSFEETEASTPSESPQNKDSSANLTQEFDDLFGTVEETPSTQTSSQGADDLNAELDSLMGTQESQPSQPSADESDSKKTQPKPPQSKTKTSEQKTAKTAKPGSSQLLAQTYYDSLEELEALLNEPVTVTAVEFDGTGIFSELESLLEQSPKTTLAPSKTPQKTSPSSKAKPSEVSSTDELDAELEKLLQQAEGSMGGSPSSKTSSGARQTRGRVSRAKVFDQTMRVPVKQLDTLSNLVGELVVNRNSLEQDQERLRQFLDNLLHQVQSLSDVGARMQDLYERSLLESSLLASRRNHHSVTNGHGEVQGNKSHGNGNGNGGDEDYDPLEMDRFTNFHLLSQEMIELIVRVRESSSDIEFLVDETDQVARNLRQVTTQLQEGLTKSRMVPFAQTADRLPRAIRDISLKLQKQAELQVEGRDTLIDKMLLEHLYDPMTHLVNNAITHGIETPAEREAQGKPPAGTITIRAFHQGNQTVISVADDGAGIDAERVKKKAIEKGLISAAEANSLSKLELYDFLFHPGFSTRDQADDFAGRGVGMDVVRTSLSDIRGNVTIDSTLGKGTTFTIRLPLTLSICKSLCCSSDSARIAFPMDGVEDMLDIHPQEMQTNSEGVDCVPWRDTLLPCQSLSDLLSYNRRVGRASVYSSRGEEDLISVVILRSVGNYIAVEVDSVIGEQEIVIKQLEGPVPKPPGIAGATVQGDGRIMAIADVLELIEISQGLKRKDSGAGALWQTSPISGQDTPAKVKTEPLVLIVDDSITVRELLSMTFTKSGYRVEQARDGQEAWDKIRSGLPCDLVFCDIEMPRMDGLELLSHLQQNEEYKDLPVALLTSRGATRHRQMAADQGARGYFTKPYLEEVLLDAAQRMLRGEDLLGNNNRPQKTESKPKSQSKVLIVDDSVTVRELLSMTFDNAGYEVDKARDGQDAWEKIHANSYDLVFCDIEMPRMDGLELLLQLQKEEDFDAPPVAMLTSRGAERHRQVAAERGASGYFTKPYLEDVLLDAAERMINGEVLLENSVKVAG